MVSRRTTVIGLGGLLVGGGGLLSTGAFTTIDAQRSVNLETAGDANAFLGLEILDEEFVDETDGTIEFDLIANATTTYEDLINIRNNGTQIVTGLRFEFLVEGSEQDADAVAEALQIISGDATIDAVDEANLLFESDAGDRDDEDQLAPSEAIPVGIRVDLTDDSIDRIDGDPEITLRIIADTGAVEREEGSEEPDGAPFDYETDPRRPPGNSNVTFTIKNTGSMARSLDGFAVESMGSQGGGEGSTPTKFDGFKIEPPDRDDPISDDGESEFHVGDNVSHKQQQYQLSSGDTVKFTLESFDENPNRNTIDFVLTDGDERFPLEQEKRITQSSN